PKRRPMRTPMPTRTTRGPTATPRPTADMFRVAFGLVAAVAVLVACGETRRPIGDECLRDEDCLSGVCAARVCSAAPSLVAGGGDKVPDEQPRLPDAAAPPPRDASPEGG